VGKDVEAWAANKKNMNESEFFNMIKNISAWLRILTNWIYYFSNKPK
jgi:hypothetical protein